MRILVSQQIMHFTADLFDTVLQLLPELSEVRSTNFLLHAGNVYGVMPRNAYLKTSIALMLIHQAIAFSLYFLPLCYIWEKLIGVHTKPLWVRIPLRLPVCESHACIALSSLTEF